MKTKYMMNRGLAFSEKDDIKKLEKLAAEGWVFEKFAWVDFYYKFVQGPKQVINYTMDFQSKPDSEYFEIFASAGWHHVSSIDNHIHVFSAPKGTPPIYSGNEIDEGKYTEITSVMGKGTVYSFLVMINLNVLTKLSKSNFEYLFWPLNIAMILSWIVFVFYFMPYVAYKYKEKMNTKLSTTGGNDEEKNRYAHTISLLGKGTWFSLDALIIFLILWQFSKYYFESLNATLLILTLVSLAALILCFTAYTVYQLKEKKIIRVIITSYINRSY